MLQRAPSAALLTALCFQVFLSVCLQRWSSWCSGIKSCFVCKFLGIWSSQIVDCQDKAVGSVRKGLVLGAVRDACDFGSAVPLDLCPSILPFSTSFLQAFHQTHSKISSEMCSTQVRKAFFYRERRSRRWYPYVR